MHWVPNYFVPEDQSEENQQDVGFLFPHISNSTVPWTEVAALLPTALEDRG